jgi:hypothetical protein
LQVAGYYRDIDLPQPTVDYSDLEEAKDRVAHKTRYIDSDTRHQVLEMHVDYDLPGFEDPDGLALPYVITIERSSRQVLAIRRNWVEGDEKKRKIEHLIHYEYIPGMGFYGFGLVHLVGGLAKSATSILRQLVDAGTLSNLPGGLKTRGLRIKGDDTPIMPGEFRDVDVPGGAIKDNLAFLPYKEPSNVLHQLLGEIVEEGRRFTSVVDIKASDMNSEAPVGTTLAILERSLKVISAIQARLHASLKKELKVLARLIKDNMPEKYPFEIKDAEATRTKDYDDRVDIIPVSNPNAATMAQRIAQHQASLQLAAQAPHIYDLPELHRKVQNALGIEDLDEILPASAEQKPADPVTENMDILNGKPVKAFLHQDHEAHIKVHTSAIEDPKMQEIVKQSPAAQMISSAADAHVREHVAMQYRREMEKAMGVELPAPDEPLPPDVENRLSKVTADAADKVLKKDIAEARQAEIMQQLEDPMLMIQREELRLKEKDIDRKALSDQMGARQKGADMIADAIEGDARLSSEEKREGARIGAEIVKALISAMTSGEQIGAQKAIQGAQIGGKVAEKLLDNQERAKDRSAAPKGGSQ